MLIAWKKEQDYAKEALGSEYQDYNLVICGATGFPVESSTIESDLKKLIRKHDLPDVVFHSLRHPYVKSTTKKYLFFLVPTIQLS